MDNKASFEDVDALALGSIHGGVYLVGERQPQRQRQPQPQTTLTTGPEGISMTCPAGTSPSFDSSHTTVKGREFEGLGSVTIRRGHTHLSCDPIKK